MNLTTTVSAARHERGSIEFQPRWDDDVIVVRGEYPISEPPIEIGVARPRPELRVGERLRMALAEAGVEVLGDVVVRRGPASQQTGTLELARVESPPISELLSPVLEDSDNWTAEMLLRVVAREAKGEGRLDLGLDLAAELLEAVGAEQTAYRLEDASGLSRGNLLTPRAVVGLLRWCWTRPWRDVWLDLLPGPGEGTLRVWPGLPDVRAKTGTLSGTVGLAGVLRPDSKEPVFFAVFLGNAPSGEGAAPRSTLRRAIVEQLRSWSGRPDAPP